MSWVDVKFETIIRFLKTRKGIHLAEGYAAIPKVLSVEKTPIGIRLDNCRVYLEPELDLLLNVITKRVAKHEHNTRTEIVPDGKPELPSFRDGEVPGQ